MNNEAYISIILQVVGIVLDVLWHVYEIRCRRKK